MNGFFKRSRAAAIAPDLHKTESVYRRYAIVSDTDLQEAARKLTEASVTDRTGTFSGTFSTSEIAPTS